VPGWIGHFGLPQSTFGFVNWVGRIKKTLFAAEQTRPDVAEKSARWHKQLAGEPAAGLVFVDESGASTKMTRLRGRVPERQRMVGRVPHGHYQTTTLVSGIRLQGPCAPWLFEGEMFLAWIVQGLVPTLQKGDSVITDNLATHKVKGVAEAIEQAGARLRYLPPYSPDFNPIENMWSKIKQIMRSADPRTEMELVQAAKIAFHATSAGLRED
jgi:hypothetical protein